MAEAIPGEDRYYVGATADVDDLKREVTGSAEVEQVSDPDEQGNRVVLLRAPFRYRDTLLQRLGPNAQEVVEHTEAERVFRNASVGPRGAPYEAEGQGETASG